MVIMMALMLVSMVMIIIWSKFGRTHTEIVNEQPDIVSPQNPIMSVKDGTVDFDHVSFAYNDDKYVLKDIDFHFKKAP